nr:hypothetical protein [Tanacetum cinerariifolium]
MEDDMLKAQIKVVDILCNLELIYPPALFDIMIHLVIHLPLEALEGGPIRPQWMYPFERHMKKLKGYVRNKAKPEGSIAEGYVAEEALTFSSHYFRDVTTNLIVLTVMWTPPPMCQFQLFRSVLYNSLEIDTYRSQFKSLFPNKDMKEEFPDWFGSQIYQCHVDNDKDPKVSTTNELFALGCGPTWTSISINSCVVDGVRYVVHSRDERHITHNSSICSPGLNGEMYYGQLQEILEFKYLLFKVVLFRVKCLNDLDNATLHIDGQSIKVDVPPDIIDVVDEDDDITDDEDALPHDLAEFNNEDLIKVDDDDVARSHDGDGKGKRKPNLGSRAAGRLNTRDKTRNLSLKEITDTKGPVPIQFELRDKQTVMSLGDHAAHWSSYIGKTQFDLRPHMESPDWTEINAGIQQHLQKAYNTNKAAFKAHHWVIDPTTGTYIMEKIRREHPENITASEWDKYSEFWNDPRNIARSAQNRQNQEKSTVISRQGSRSLARLRDEM